VLFRDDVGELIPPFGGGKGGDVVLFVDTSVQARRDCDRTTKTARVCECKSFLCARFRKR
jgi:hypothetical protein